MSGGSSRGETPRVLHVLEALEGGTARYLVDVARHVQGYEHHTVIPTRRVGGETDELANEKLRAAGAVVHLVELRRSPLRARNAAGLLEVRRLIRELRPVIVHAHSSIGGAVGRVAALGSGASRIYTPQGLSTSRAALVIERALGKITDHFVAVSPSEAKVVTDGGLVPAGRVVMIPNGIEAELPPEGPDLRALLSIPPDAPIVGTVARLVAQKAPEDFVRACAVVRAAGVDAHFVLIGAGPLRALLEDELRRAGLHDRFHHLPGLPGAAGVLGQFDVFALSSRFEGAAYAPLEAMRAGTPVVLTDVVGSHDTVVHGESGVLVPPGEPAALGRAIVDLLADPNARRQMGEAGRMRVQARFDVRVMAAALAALYETAVR